MTFKELKNSTASLLDARREVEMPTEDEKLIPLVDMHLLNVANRYKVLSLMTKSRHFKILRALDKGWYIRMPNSPVEDDELDLDEELHLAIANYLAADLCTLERNREDFLNMAKKIIKDYAFKIYKTPLGADDE